MANQVTLTFAGKSQDLEQSMDRAGAGAETMAVRISDATNASAERFDHLSSQSSLLSGGIGDVGGALTTAFGENTAIGEFGAKMESASAVVMGFTGLMDLGVFATNNFKLASAASAVQTGVTSAATKAAAAAQWLMNTALLASPITWIVIGIVALIAVIVLIATKTDWFQKGWKAAWGWIKDAASNTWDFIKKIPGWLGDAFGKIANFITLPFRAGFNAVAKAWNNTIGQLSWTVPGWVPFIGGNSISVPHLPTFHAGGIVPGVVGTPTVALLQAGERVGSIASSGGGAVLEIRSSGSALDDLLVEILSRAARRSGGDVQATYGGRNARA
jgi:hypothetical protein